MRRKNRFSIESKYVLVFFLILSLILMITSFKYKEAFAPVRAVVGDVVTPMQKGINQVGRFFSDKTKNFTSMQKLLEENEYLRMENAYLKKLNALVQERIERENKKK